MKSLSVFRQRVSPRVQGCSDALIDQAVLDACIDFCSRSLVVKRMLDSFLTVASTLEYDLAAANQQSVASVTRVWCESTELTPLDEDALATPFGFVASIPGQTNNTGLPRFFSESSPGVLALYPMPNAAYTINMRVALRPTRSATQVEDQLFEDWVDVIMDGALKNLYMIPGEFFSATLAKHHSTQFEIGVNAAMLEARRGATRAQSRVTPVHI